MVRTKNHPEGTRQRTFAVLLCSSFAALYSRIWYAQKAR
jgi:hypothetical protein